VTTTSSPPHPPAAAGAPPQAPAAWLVWAALWTVYIVWGSTYLAIRVMVETMPPLLSAGVRFSVAGAVLLAVLAARGRRVRLDRRRLASAALVGTLLMGANGLVTVAEQEVPSGIAALLVATVPLWVILLRRLAHDAVSRASVAAVAVGFAGSALLLLPGGEHGSASLLGLLGVVFAALMWATGSFASPRVPLPREPLVSVGWQMLAGGLVSIAAALALGEGGDVELSAFSARSLLAFGYLVVFGSWVAFTAYAWLLQNAPLSKVSTYAYVNPVVAIALGALVLSEPIGALTVVAAAVVVTSVALVVSLEHR
jgi:drug/metabolite transporter (DMT)-like permease